MSPSDDLAGVQEVPDAIITPCAIDGQTETFPLWSGPSELLQDSVRSTGQAKVYFDTLPRPMFRFEFQQAPCAEEPQGLAHLLHWDDTSRLQQGHLICDYLLGSLSAIPRNARGNDIAGEVSGWSSPTGEHFTSGKLLIINGPKQRGSLIKKDKAYYAGRSRFSDQGRLVVTLDYLSGDKQDRRSLFAFTHVAEIRFDQPKSAAEFEQAAEILFRAYPKNPSGL